MLIFLVFTATNQDRIRRCGGFEIFVKQLGAVLNTDNSDEKDILSHLLSTVDSCIMDNGEKTMITLS